MDTHAAGDELGHAPTRAIEHTKRRTRRASGNHRRFSTWIGCGLGLAAFVLDLTRDRIDPAWSSLVLAALFVTALLVVAQEVYVEAGLPGRKLVAVAAALNLIGALFFAVGLFAADLNLRGLGIVGALLGLHAANKVGQKAKWMGSCDVTV